MGTRDVLKPGISLALLCGGLFASAYAAPVVLPYDDPRDVVTRQTARVAVLFWWLAAALLLLEQRLLARWTWTLACAAYLGHVATAFDKVHGWSHAAAVRHVEAMSGFGSGLFVSYAFSVLWVADVAWWWVDRPGYDRRLVWLDWLVHLFMAVVVFNGTVVYESGFIRWAGAVLFVALGALTVRRLIRVQARQ